MCVFHENDHCEPRPDPNNCFLSFFRQNLIMRKNFRVSGVVCGIYGTEIRTGKGKGTTGGKFLVEEIVFAEKPVQTKLEPLKEDRSGQAIDGKLFSVFAEAL